MGLTRRLRQAYDEWWAYHVSQVGDPRKFRPMSFGRSPLLRLILFYVWDYPFTRAGKLLIAAFFFSTLPGAITEEVPMYVVPVALLSLVLVLSGIGSVFRMAKCELKPRWPERVSAGQTVVVPVTVTNTGRLPIYDLSVGCFGLPDSWEPVRDDLTLPVLARGESATLSIRMTAWQRGLYRLPPLRAFSTFPFHLFRNEVSVTPGGTVLVLPRFHVLQEVRLDAADRHQPGGIAFSSQVGESPEYIGNRDYVPGDALRRIDFRSWARLARPVVREYQDEYYSRIALVMDTFVSVRRSPGKRGFPELEAAVSLTAALAHAVSQGEAVIDIFAAGPELHVFRTGRHTTPFEHILEILAGIGPSRLECMAQLTPALSDQWRDVSSVVCVFLQWDEARVRLCRQALQDGCRVKVILIRTGRLPAPQEPGVEILVHSPAQIETGLASV